MSDTHLIGVFNQPGGEGCVAECGQCGRRVILRTESRVKSTMTAHYRSRHPELAFNFKRYNQDG